MGAGGGGAGGRAFRPSPRAVEVLKQVGVFLLFCFVLVPAIVMALACLFGAILAAAEGWSFYDGFLYVISNMTQLANPLTEVMPDTVPGQIFDIIIALWSLAVAGTVIGVVASLGFVTTFVQAVEGRREGEMDERQLSALAKAMQRSGTMKEFDREEFKKVIGGSEQDAEAAFVMLDVNEDGKLGRDEIQKALDRQGSNSSGGAPSATGRGGFLGKQWGGGGAKGGGQGRSSRGGPQGDEILASIKSLADEQRRLAGALAALNSRMEGGGISRKFD